LGLVLLSAIHHIVPLLALAVFLFVLAVVSWFWSQQSLRGMSFQITLNQSSAFPGEKINLTLQVINGKWLPLPWLEVEEELPYKLINGVKPLSPYAKERLLWTTSVSKGQRISWKHRLECKARGEYRLGPVRLRSGDVFGLFPKEMILPHFEQVLVYPQIVPVDKLNLPLRELVGERSAPRNIYEDVSRTMGPRDYQHDDPFKRIHWKASARHYQLQSRLYESTTSLNLFLILDVHSFCQREQPDEQAFELAVTTVASLAYKAHREEYSVGLMANSVPEIQIPLSAGYGHLLVLLETLARIEAKSRLLLHEQLDKDKNSLPLGATLIVIARVLSPSLAGMVQKLHREGYSLFLLSVGEQIPIQNASGIPVIYIQSLNDLSRSYEEAKL